MTLVRVFSKLDEKNKITIPRGIRKELKIRPGEKLELKVVGLNKARKLLITKPPYQKVWCAGKQKGRRVK